VSVSRILTRRKFIFGVTAATLLAGCDSHPVSGFLNAMKDWNAKFEAALFSPHRLAPELPASEQTPEQSFPSYFISDSMPFPPLNWTLAVNGLVKHPMVLTLAQLHNMPRIDMRVRHHCVEGWSAVAQWSGVRVIDIARMAGLDAKVKYVEFRSFDSDYWSSWDLESALHPQTLLAYGMNGRMLHPDHGAPLRLYSAVKLGYKMVKYLTEVNFLSHNRGGYWENQGYDWFAGV
jgi:DMSO/TMAO reductase YedYZ molybdopterin-dependent catalytic subunit